MRRHHLHPDAAWLPVFGRDHGLVQPQSTELATIITEVTELRNGEAFAERCAALCVWIVAAVGLEVVLILFAWLVLFGISYGFKITAHLGVDAIINIVGSRLRRGAGVVAGHLM